MVVQWLRSHGFTAGSTDSTVLQGTKTPTCRAVWQEELILKKK